jgi:hypothetical protein
MAKMATSPAIQAIYAARCERESLRNDKASDGTQVYCRRTYSLSIIITAETGGSGEGTDLTRVSTCLLG